MGSRVQADSCSRPRQRSTCEYAHLHAAGVLCAKDDLHATQQH